MLCEKSLIFKLNFGATTFGATIWLLIVTAIGDMSDGNIIKLEMTGTFYDGTNIQGTDSVLIIIRGNQYQKGNGKQKEKK